MGMWLMWFRNQEVEQNVQGTMSQVFVWQCRAQREWCDSLETKKKMLLTTSAQHDKEPMFIMRSTAWSWSVENDINKNHFNIWKGYGVLWMSRHPHPPPPTVQSLHGLTHGVTQSGGTVQVHDWDDTLLQPHSPSTRRGLQEGKVSKRVAETRFHRAEWTCE